MDRFVGDCANCVGLCCVALSRSREGGFGADAPAGQPCHHLLPDHRCEIHATLRRDGWPACTVFDCFGAGQQVTGVTFASQHRAGTDWRASADLASQMFAAFHTMRQLMEMRRHLAEAERLAPQDPQVAALAVELERLVALPAPELAGVAPAQLRTRVGEQLRRVSAQVRRPAASSRRLRPGAMLLGAQLRSRDLSRLDLRGAVLIAADLRQAVLHRTDLLGTDLRDADLRGADLSQALFLTPPQLASAHGDARTRLPPGLERPRHWLGPGG